MIFHKLVLRFLRYKDDEGFYRLQAEDTVRWLEKSGVVLGDETSVLDLGCGHGILGGELASHGCAVTFADEENQLLPRYRDLPFVRIDVDRDDLGMLGTYDLVICSNVLEHIPRPARLLSTIDRLLSRDGKLYLSWTNWLSPWGGQDFSPFHYLGPRLGPRVYDRLTGRQRIHTPYVTLFPTSIGGTIRTIKRNPGLRVLKVLPRYYPEVSFIAHIPVVREFLTWNCVIFIERTSGPGP
jgi:SAM-dependent methyltransferase